MKVYGTTALGRAKRTLARIAMSEKCQQRNCMSFQSFTLHGSSVSARPYFVDPNARNERVALRHLLRVVEICRVDDREAGNGVGAERKVLRSVLRDFATIAAAAHVYRMRLGCLKPFAPGGHDFRGGFFKSVMQQHKLLHARLLFTGWGKCFLFGEFAFAAIASAYCSERATAVISSKPPVTPFSLQRASRAGVPQGRTEGEACELALWSR